MRTVHLIDRTKNARPTGQFLTHAAAALRASLVDFCRDWQFSTSWSVVVGSGPSAITRPGDFGIVLSDSADEPGAAGYHATNPDGSPMVKVFTETILESGTWSSGPESVMTCLDHEAKETVLDMPASLFAVDWHGRAWAYEACDAVQSSAFAGLLGFPLANYLLPAYFAVGSKGPFDKLGRLKTQFSVDRGGYAIVATLSGEKSAFGDRAGWDDAAVLGFEVYADPDGVGALIVDPEYAMPEGLKSDVSSRTMRRLVVAQRG